MTSRLTTAAIWAAPMLVAVGLLTYRLGDVAGLYRDEAAFGLFAETIQAGARPLSGYFNDYTSPLHSYLIALSFWALGEAIWTLRLSGVVFNLLAAALYGDLLRRNVPERAIWGLWFLVTMPAYVVFARISGENYALNAFFLVAAAWCYQTWGASQRKGVSRIGLALTGLSLVLGVLNHLIFLPTLAGLVVSYSLFRRAEWRKLFAQVPWLVTGGGIAAIPKLYAVLFRHQALVTLEGKVGAPLEIEGGIANFFYALGGDGLYLNTCGQVIVSLTWFLPAVVLLCIATTLCGAASARRKSIVLYLLLFFAISFLGTWAITPYYKVNPRTWLLPLWCIPAAYCVSLPETLGWRRGIGIAVVVVNLFAVGTNYFYNFLSSGGLAVAPNVGGRVDFAWDFMDIRPTVNRLVAYGDAPIYLQDITTHRLTFLLPKNQRHRVRVFIRDLPPDFKFELGSLLGVIASPDLEFSKYARLARSMGEKIDELSDDHYVFYRIIIEDTQGDAALH